jgi:ribosomal small subunit protein bTHX
MGKGDKKSKRGKIVIGSFGIRRPRKKSYTPVKVDNAQVEAKAVQEKSAVSEVKDSDENAVIKQSKPVKEKKEPKAEKSEKVAKPKKEQKD